MAPSGTSDDVRRPVPRVFLERVARPLLTRILSPHDPVLTGKHGFPLGALGASAQTDRVQVEALWNLLSVAPPDLTPLRDELLAIADVGTVWGQELLLSRDTEHVLDPELGAEDCAATAYLDLRPLFDTARPQTAGQAQLRSFASFQSDAPRPMPSDASCRNAFERTMSKELDARGRSPFFKAHEWRSGDERHFELVYGKLAATRDLIGKTKQGETAPVSHDVTAQVTDRTSERAHAVFHDDTLRLDIAGHDWMKELVRRVVSESYFGSAAHFHGSETVSLLPLLDLDAALACDDVPGLRKVEIQQLWFDLSGNGAWVAMGARSDCVRSPCWAYAQRALTEGKPCEATFHLYLANRARPTPLKLVAPRRLDFSRRDPKVVRIVRDWVIARGFMKLPGGGAASEAGAISSQS